MGDVKEILHRRVARAGSPAFDLASISNTVGAQSLAFFARAGTGDASANGSGLPRTADRVNSERTLAWHDKRKYRPHRHPPLQKRKEGAPTVRSGK